MKNDVEIIFGKQKATAMDGMVRAFRNADTTPEKIAESIQNLHETTRAGIHISALSSGDKETANKIDKANQIIKEKRINEFKKAVESGKGKEFLSTMSWTDKISLQVDIEYSEEDTKNYIEIIEESIGEDIENEALRQGFSSVEEWRNHNAKVASSIEQTPTRIIR